jgi:hypothetical protein
MLSLHLHIFTTELCAGLCVLHDTSSSVATTFLFVLANARYLTYTVLNDNKFCDTLSISFVDQ